MRIRITPSRALFAAIAALGLSSIVNAQSVATAPVGAVSKAIPVGLNSVGITLTNPNLVVASCTANSSSSITLSGVSNVGALLTTGMPYYVEAISGPLEGERFEVNTGSTISGANSVVVLNTASANNTFALSADVAVGTQFALRQHITLAQVQSFFSTPLVGNDSPELADQIQFLNAAGSAFTVYYLRGSGTQWRLQGNPSNANNVAVPPGVGIMIRKVGSPATLSSVGSVRTNDFAMPMGPGRSFRAHGYPVSYSPALLGGTQANGWVANDSTASADQLQVLNGAGNALTTYFLRATGGGVVWRLEGNPTNVSASQLFPFDTGFFVNRKNSDTDYILTTPFTL